MAGDWIKMRAALCTNPKVLMIAGIVGASTEVGRRLSTGFSGALRDIVTSDVTRDVTLGCLLRVWSATNEHTSDGVWFNSSLETIDAVAGIPGFGEAMAAAEWAIYDEAAGTVTLPNFLENNAPAKHNARSTSAERQARYRARKSGQSSDESDAARDVTRDVTSNAREEKRREEKKEHTEPSGSVPARKARGQRRCPETFEVTDEMREWARASAPSANVDRETMKFRNHEFAKARSDWMATWQNWILKADESAPSTPQGRPPPESFRAQEQRLAAERVAEASPRIARRMNPNPTFEYVDMETADVPRLA